MQQEWKAYGSYGTLGLEFSLSVLFGLFGGQWINEKVGANGWITLVGFGFGIVAGSRAIWRAVQRANREAERFEAEEQEAQNRYHDDR
ncbi:MAG: AtpZ/AtpI family protein [Polyangiaceae bacterium]|nr:AtpZ/AtpI family protein [Polyangiaceae bacterium]